MDGTTVPIRLNGYFWWEGELCSRWQTRIGPQGAQAELYFWTSVQITRVSLTTH